MYHFPLAKPIEACPKVHRLSVNICAVVPGSKHRVTWLIITIINVQRCYRRYCSAPTRIHTPIRYTLAPNGKMPRLECWRWSFLINVALYWSCGLFSFEFRFDDGRCCDESAGIGRKLRAHFWIIHFFFCAARERCEHIGPTVTGVFSCASLVGWGSMRNQSGWSLSMNYKW